MKLKPAFIKGLGLCLLILAVACQKDVPTTINGSIFPENSESRLKSTPNTANLDQLLVIIADKINSGEISMGNGNALTAKINSAKKNISKGQLKAAENVLNAFINQVNSLVTDGVMTPKLGQLLSTKANEVLNPPAWKCGENFIDARDGHNYKSVLIGDQCWMAENLAYLPSVNSQFQASFTSPHYYVYGYDGTDVASARATDNYASYGALYNWTAAISDCPVGWHLPSYDEWNILENYLGDMASSKLKISGWASGTNESGFSAIPAGMKITGVSGFYGLGNYIYLWSSTSGGGNNAWFRYLYYSDGFGLVNFYNDYGFSVRCVKD